MSTIFGKFDPTVNYYQLVTNIIIIIIIISQVCFSLLFSCLDVRIPPAHSGLDIHNFPQYHW